MLEEVLLVLALLGLAGSTQLHSKCIEELVPVPMPPPPPPQEASLHEYSTTKSLLLASYQTTTYGSLLLLRL